MDAGLAKVMNSSVGSNNLIPLNTILKADNTTIANDAADRLFNNFKNSTKLVASDETMFAYNGQWEGIYIDSDSTTSWAMKQFVQFDKSGTVRFMLPYTNTHSSSTVNQRLHVVDTNNKTIAKSSAIEVPPKTSVLIWVDVDVVAGNKYKGVAETSSYVNSLTVGAKPVLFGATATLSS